MRWLEQNWTLPALALGWAVITASPVCAQALVGASSDEHLWFIGPSTSGDDTSVLYHHALTMEGPHYRGRPQNEMPEAVAAFKEALAECRVAEDRLREVLTEGGWLE